MKEQVIVFEGEQMFVAPKKRISNKQKGIQVEVPEVDVVGDPTPTLDPPIEAPRQPDEPAEPIRVITTPPSGSGDIGVRTPQTFGTQQPVAPSPTVGTLPPRLPVDPTPLPVLGNPTRNLPPAAEEQPTPPAPTPPADIVIRKEIIAPLGLGAAPIMGGGGIGGGGGGGGAEEEGVPVEEKKSYWWLWLLLIGGAAYYYSKKKK
jgi:hypothetical protein